MSIKPGLAIAGMVTIAFAIGGCASTVRAAGPPRPPQLAVDISVFYDDLAPYGDWVREAEYGWVWIPGGVPVGWRPYTNGYWVLTDYGWTWVSNWRWGWAPFHYGRWVLHQRHGWVWIPGRVWGPAWVVWRYGPGWVGWAPMPPQPGWSVGMEFGIGGDFDVLIAAHWYSFVPERRFIDRNLGPYFALPARNVTLVRETRYVTNYVTIGNRVVNRSIDVQQIERATGRRIAERRVVDGRDDVRASRSSEVPFRRPNIGPNAPPPERVPRDVGDNRRAIPRDAAQQRELEKREAQETQQLQQEQEREKQRLEALQRQEQQRSAVPRDREQLERQQQAERRAQSDQRQREEAVLKDRQERRRQKADQAQPDRPARRPARGK